MGSPGTSHHDLCGDAGPLARTAPDETTCDLCGEPCSRSPAGYDVAGFDICIPCLEDML